MKFEIGYTNKTLMSTKRMNGKKERACRDRFTSSDWSERFFSTVSKWLSHSLSHMLKKPQEKGAVLSGLAIEPGGSQSEGFNANLQPESWACPSAVMPTLVGAKRVMPRLLLSPLSLYHVSSALVTRVKKVLRFSLHFLYIEEARMALSAGHRTKNGLSVKRLPPRVS
ncbi:hypothetical protein OUZ56_027081 [Daphnia magna]|uniref:Uncharacterized protein n=1 Tax=Daphnia magna TaxID=35525 RepID=A0ABQ9ZQ16_9CRUS|nr:hypothetical protein OUZ56_027081 [Daphnia magna]